MALKRQVAAPPAPVNTADGAFNFGDAANYTGGGALPEGDYLIRSADCVMHAGFTANTQAAQRLGLMIVFSPMDNINEEKKVFYSFGGSAAKSFAPSASGKGIIPIPNAAGSTLNDQTNFAMFRKSLIDSTMPPEIWQNDCSVIEGAWVHTQNVDEPEERKGFVNANATSEAAPQQQERKPNKVTIITEILDGGAPWEGGGGLPAEGTAPAPAVAAPKVNGLAKPPVGAVRGKPAPAPVASVDDQIADSASKAVYDILADGGGAPISKLKLQLGTFKAASAAFGGDMAQAIQETYFGTDAAALNSIIAPHGFKLVGVNVVPA
jgi:hypothetical protein